MRILVIGGRTYANEPHVARVLGEFHGRHTLRHGACHLGGLDLLADRIARILGWDVEPFPVDHAVDGPWPGAGPRRNARMIAAEGVIDIALVFPGGSGTRGCEAMARRAGILTRRV